MPDVVDLRSDTVTRPTAEMRRAIAGAEVGDDVLGDDPTIHRLEEGIAEITGKEAALYVVSGTLGNQLAIRSQTHHGEEVLIDRQSHIFNYESAAAAAISGVQLHPLDGDHGRIDPETVSRCGRPLDDHFPPLTLLCLENTHNRAGGAVVPLDALEAAATAARALGLSVHLDGARLWNASAASGVTIERYSRLADTVMLCFSKGLGAPVGSVLAGRQAVIRRARRFRKMLGGGIRQGGVLAAACLHALEHHRERLAEDHQRARRFAEAVAEIPGLRVRPERVETNIVHLELARVGDDAGAALARLRKESVWLSPFSSRIVRAYFHLGIDDRDLERAIDGVRRAFADARTAPG